MGGQKRPFWDVRTLWMAPSFFDFLDLLVSGSIKGLKTDQQFFGFSWMEMFLMGKGFLLLIGGADL